MTLKEKLAESRAFISHNDVFYQHGLPRHLPFEKNYIDLRSSEHRLYSDDQVQQLPNVSPDHALTREWTCRKKSLHRLLDYLEQKTGSKKILEIGCGNGWLAHHLAALPDSEVLAVDINETELIQGARVFRQCPNLAFAYADCFAVSFPMTFNFIVLASSIQYFQDANSLILKLKTLLGDKGEIHILDSPFYKQAALADAQKRSEKYFSGKSSGMQRYYHHHSREAIESFHPEVLYDPKSILNRLRARVSPDSPFLWMRIKK